MSHMFQSDEVNIPKHAEFVSVRTKAARSKQSSYTLQQNRKNFISQIWKLYRCYVLAQEIQNPYALPHNIYSLLTT